MNNLNKSDFWDPLREIAPDAVDKFCKWVDEYKKEVGWTEKLGIELKFHDLPFELQVGIIHRFNLEMTVPIDDRNDACESATNHFIKQFRSKMIMFQHNLEAKKEHLTDRINKEQGN